MGDASRRALRLRPRRYALVTDAAESDELPLAEGQQVRVLQVQDDGWWLGYAAGDPEHVGLFPSNYVRQEYELQPQQQDKVLEAQYQQRRGVRQQAEDGSDDADGDGDGEQQAQTQVDDENEQDQGDNELQQHQRQTHQRIQQQRQYQRPQETNGRRRNRLSHDGENEDEDVEDEEDDVPVAPVQQRMVSVLQLKRSLAGAERASEAARAARLQAERERAQQQRHRPPVRIARNEEEEDGDDNEEQDEEDGGRAHLRQQQQQRRIPLEVEDDGDDDDNDAAAFQYSQSNQRHVNHEQDDDDADEEEEQGVEDDDADEGVNDDGGSFSVPAVLGSRMKDVISAYQAQQDVDQEAKEEEALAATRIARKYQNHRIRQQSQLQQRSFAERENAAALAIQRWMLRTSSQQRTRAQILESEQREPDNERIAQVEILEQEQKVAVEAAAVTRIQTWMRHLLAYFRWKEHVEKERVAMLKRKRVKMLQLEQEARQKAEQEEQLRRQQEEEKEEEQERLRLEQQQLERQQRLQREQEQRQREQRQQHQQQAATPHQREGNIQKEDKSRKKIMKKEAVDLVKTLVKKQLDEKLREHDEKMGELQRLVTTLQDVIRKQNEMLIQDSNDRLVVDPQGARKFIKTPMQTLGNPQQHHYMPPSTKQLMQASGSSSSLASENQLPSSSAAAVKESFIPKPPSRSSMLPQIGGNAAAKLSKQSGIKPPRSNDVPSRLPVLSNANARQSSHIPVKR